MEIMNFWIWPNAKFLIFSAFYKNKFTDAIERYFNEKSEENIFVFFFICATYTWQHKFIFTGNTKFWNRKPNYFYLLWRWIILFLFNMYSTNNKRVLFSASVKGWVICVGASTCVIFRYLLLLCLQFFLFSHKKWGSR
jgi:hypothetical protein